MKDPSDASPRPEQTVSPRIGVCSWSLRPDSPEALIESLQRLGVTGVQLDLTSMLAQPDAWNNAAVNLRKAGLNIMSGMMRLAGEDYATLETIRETGGVRLDSTWQQNQDHAQAIAEFAQDAQIELVTFHAGFIPEDVSDPEHAKLVERLRTLADIFADHGVSVAFETGQETADTLLEALAAIDRTTVGINFDPANMILYGTGDPVESLKQLSPFVKQIHIKDAQATATPGTWGREVPVGEGGVKWDEFMAAALAIRPSVNFVIEREAGEGREADIAAARNMLTQHV